MARPTIINRHMDCAKLRRMLLRELRPIAEAAIRRELAADPQLLCRLKRK